MCILLASEWLDGFYSHSVFKGIPIKGQFLVNLSIPATKIGVLQTGSKSKIPIFFETALILITFEKCM
jgi:hypothetical protein